MQVVDKLQSTVKDFREQVKWVNDIHKESESESAKKRIKDFKEGMDKKLKYLEAVEKRKEYDLDKYEDVYNMSKLKLSEIQHAVICKINNMGQLFSKITELEKSIFPEIEAMKKKFKDDAVAMCLIEEIVTVTGVCKAAATMFDYTVLPYIIELELRMEPRCE
jgi:hypothetical protein